MAFGHRLRALHGSSKEIKMQQRAESDQQQQEEEANAITTPNAQAARQHLRLNSDGAPRHERAYTSSHITSVRPARGMTMTTSTTSASAYFDAHVAASEPHRQRRGMTITSSSSQQQHQRQHNAHQHYPEVRARATTSATHTSSSHASDRAETKADILYRGHLMVKRGLLKGLEKRFYFVTRSSADLYCCKDETSFNLWLASGWALNAGNAIATGSGLAPVRMCTVLHAVRASESPGGGSDRAIVLTPADSTAKGNTLKFYAESVEKCDRWLRAFRRVQIDSVAGDPAAQSSAPSPHTASSHSTSSHSAMNNNNNNNTHHDDIVASPRANKVQSRSASRSDASQSSTTSGNAPRAYAGGQLRTKSREDARSVKSIASSSSDISEATSQKSDPSVQNSQQSHSHHHRSANGNGVLLNSSGSQGNVLLFVPAAGSTISVSDSKIARAKQQVEELSAKGYKRPTRSGMGSINSSTNQVVKWRYGPPEYVLSDLEYMQHKLREHESTPLESYVEASCQTFLMEATHKAVYNDWVSVRHECFYLQVNDGGRILGHAIQENDMFGLLFVNDDNMGNDVKDPRAILAEAFTDGFPMEVLNVFTQPPQCHFSWRHWGPFSGRYNGVKGDGSLIEIRGFGQMQIDSNRMLNLRLFFKPKELFDELHKASERISKDVVRTRGVSSAIPYVPATARSSPAPTSSPPVTATKSKAAKTADILNDLANFTIASSKENSKS
ncbi:hypothetical protein FI667_g12733, partial [Globisporangium splendens]